MTTGERIKKARINAGLTQKELAQKIGVAEITIRQYEADKRLPKNKDITGKLADALHVSGSYLIWGDENAIKTGIIDTKVRAETDEETLKSILKTWPSDLNSEAREYFIQLLSQPSQKHRKSQKYFEQLLSKEDFDYKKSKTEKITEMFDILNDVGQDKAIEQVEMLTKIPEYRKENSQDQEVPEADQGSTETDFKE